jgi:signal transduction histidine kinase
MRRRILLLVVGTTLLVVLSFAIPLAILIGSQVRQQADRAATDEANQVALFLRTDSPTQARITTELARVNRGPRLASVVLPDGTVLGKAPPASAKVPGSPVTFGAGERTGFPNGGFQPAPGQGGRGPQASLRPVTGGQVAEINVPTSAGFNAIRVYLSDSSVSSAAARWWALLTGCSVALLLIGAGGGELLTRRIVRPLVDTAQTANRITAGDVTARAPVNGPREIAEVGSALNRLADRIDELIAEERETVADMSHRLRTPLTALRLDAEALRDPVEAERVGSHVSALERMLTAVIRSARRPQREGRMPSADASAVVGNRVLFWSALTEEQGRTCTTDLPSTPLLVRASAEDLAAAVDALLENVVAHTPEGTSFAVRLAPTAPVHPGAVLEISDDGPGLPADALVRGRSDRGSTGLGLSIANRCADGSGGSMTVGCTPTGGALITPHLGAP